MKVEQLRTAWIDWVDDHDWDDYLTINFNCPSDEVTAKKQLGSLLQRLDSYLLGSRYRRRPAERTFGICFPEHIHINCHWHCLLKYNCNPSQHGTVSRSLLEYFWKGIVASGTIHLQDAYDAGGAARYSTKEFGTYERFGSIAFSSDFWPEASRQELESVNWNQLHKLERRARHTNYRHRRLRREPQPG